MASRPLKIALVQHRCTADRAQNLDATIAGVRAAAATGARLVLLQELHRSLYFCQNEDSANFDLAESIPGPTTQVLAESAAALGIVVVASLFERRAAGLYHNTAVVFERDGSLECRA